MQLNSPVQFNGPSCELANGPGPQVVVPNPEVTENEVIAPLIVTDWP